MEKKIPTEGFLRESTSNENYAYLCQSDASSGLPSSIKIEIRSSLYHYYISHTQSLPSSLAGELTFLISQIQQKLKRGFGSEENPLLLSLSSHIPSQSGYLHTIDNLGLNEAIVAASSSEYLSYDRYIRLLASYGTLAFGIPPCEFASAYWNIQRIRLGSDLSCFDLRCIKKVYAKVIQEYGKVFPQNPWNQLKGGIEALLESYLALEQRGDATDRALELSIHVSI